MKAKGRAWPLPKLLAANRNAMTVYAALRWQSGEDRQLNTTRHRIAAVCGLHPETITDAMRALNESGWLSVSYGRQGNRTWYRLTFPVHVFFPVTEKTRPREASGNRKNPPQGSVPCGGKKTPHIRKYVGQDAPRSEAVAPAPETEHPSVRIERERMAAIRAKRKAAEAARKQTRGTTGDPCPEDGLTDTTQSTQEADHPGTAAEHRRYAAAVRGGKRA